ncbi:hypothetical protein FQA39_LY19338 [Lamprigera yunnana]|nr:hypothetical protein FQA39_LY19338 [Lamprigera yunnana]
MNKLDPQFALPAASLDRMAAALGGFVEGKIERQFWSPRPDREVRKIAALAALAMYGKAQPRMLTSINIAPNDWPTQTVVDWLSILQNMKDAPNRSQLMAEANQILRTPRLSYQGTKLVFANENNDYYWLMQNGDTALARFLLVVMGDSAWKDDMPRLVSSFIGRQKSGAWNTTTAKTVGANGGWRRFSRTYETEPVTGTTEASMGGKSAAVDWSKITKAQDAIEVLANQGQGGNRADGPTEQIAQWLNNTMDLPWAVAAKCQQSLRSAKRHGPSRGLTGKLMLQYTYRVNNTGRVRTARHPHEAVYAPEMFGMAPQRKITVGASQPPMMLRQTHPLACPWLGWSHAPLWPRPCPSFAECSRFSSRRTRVLSREGELLQRVRTDAAVRRGDWVALGDVSAALRTAMLLSEDRRFYEHSGVDWAAVTAAAWGNLWNQRTRGASTITMQLAGLLDGDWRRSSGRRTVVQKAGQTVAAQVLDRRWSKTQILEAYLNLVPFRGEVVGIDALSRTLFGKAAHGLDDREAAVAAALRFAVETLGQHLQELRASNVQDGALVVLDNASGEVLAWVGSSGALSQAQEVDAVLAPRQPGSTLKPFLYGQAIAERKLTAASLIEDSPARIPTASGLYIPQNYDRSFKGWVSVRTALGASLNVPAVRSLVMVGVDDFFDQLNHLGMPMRESGSYFGYSLALGSPEIPLLQLTNAYRALANGGRYSAVVYDKVNNAGKPQYQQVLDAGAAFIVGDMLADNNARVRTFGTSSVLGTRSWTAVKTGTSKDMRDNWALGWSDR